MKENDLYVKSEKYKCKIGEGEFFRVIIKLDRIKIVKVKVNY